MSSFLHSRTHFSCVSDRFKFWRSPQHNNWNISGLKKRKKSCWPIAKRRPEKIFKKKEFAITKKSEPWMFALFESIRHPSGNGLQKVNRRLSVCMTRRLCGLSFVDVARNFCWTAYWTEFGEKKVFCDSSATFLYAKITRETLPLQKSFYYRSLLLVEPFIIPAVVFLPSFFILYRVVNREVYLWYSEELLTSVKGKKDSTMEQFTQFYWAMFCLKLIICVKNEDC